jgi:RNA polymerase sigma factor (sigma-70 family)
MAFQTIKESSTGPGRFETPSQPPSAAPFATRISPADELQFACRLAECRRELLAIALLDANIGRELSRVATEVATGVRRLSDVLEAAQESPDAGLLALRQFSARVALLQAAAALVPPGQGDGARAEKQAFEALCRDALDVIKELPLASDLVDRLLSSSWTASGRAEGPGLLRAPRPLRQRARQLDGEIETIRARFIHANQGLVAYVVQRYRGMGLRREDLMQEGNIGLLRAIEKYDHRRGTRFSVYAVWWIRQAVRRALANQSRTIRIPVHALAVRYAVDQASKRLSLQLGREPSEQELSTATGVVPNSVAQVLGMVREPLSLDAPRGPDTEASLGESVADRASISPNEHAARKERADRLRGLLDGLSVREREMLRMRYGLDGADECTLEQIGQSFALTRERVRQIVTAALGKLHHQTQVRHLELEPTAD